MNEIVDQFYHGMRMVHSHSGVFPKPHPQETTNKLSNGLKLRFRICVFTFYTNVFRILLYNSCDLCESSDGAVMLYLLYLQLHVAYTHRPQSTAERAVCN